MIDSTQDAQDPAVTVPDTEPGRHGVAPGEPGDLEPSMDARLTAPSAPTTLAKLRGLPWSMAGNSFNTIFAQFTFFGSVFVLFLNTLGLSKGQIGGLLSLLPFTSVLALFLASSVARFGYKRTFLTAYGARKVVTAMLLLTPWIVTSFGSTAALRFVMVIVALFAILRALMEIALMPWVQEYVPNSVRGKYAATDNMYVTVAGIFAIAVAGAVIGRTTGLTGYMALIAVGVIVGFFALWCYSFIPGGAPFRSDQVGQHLKRNLGDALGDLDFRRYLMGVSLVTLGITPMAAFLPLYLQEQVGMGAGQVVWVQIGTLVGSLLSSYLWGWAADRYGSSPVMRSGAIALALLPIFWWLMPRHAEVSLYVALGIALYQGIAGLGWVIGAGRLLHVSLVPPEKKVGYMALYSALIGVVAGGSQLAGGWILDMTQGLSAQVAIFVVDPYFPLFVIGVILSAASLPVLQGIRAELAVGVREFAGLFFRGNPFMAMSALIRIQLAKDERTTVLRTEQLGHSGSRLTVEELIDALSDPRFQVRYEAAISISRMRRDPRLTRAMVTLLEGTELPLSVQAAWALGRMGDTSAIEPLRRAMDNPYRSIQVHSIRALGTLGDMESIPIMLERLRSETDKGLQMAYASALGNLGANEALGDLLSLLNGTQNQGARMELTLAVARLVGKEHLFIRLLHQTRADPGTAAAQALSTLRRRLGQRRRRAPVGEMESIFEAGTNAFAGEDLTGGAGCVAQIAGQLPPESVDELPRTILQECGNRLAQYGSARMEYVVLALHTMNVAWQP